MFFLKNRIMYYGQQSSFHGLKYISDPKRNILTKIFWIFAMIVSGIGLWYILRGAYENYEHHAINFATETTYLEWNTTFPAVSICEITSRNTLFHKLQHLMPDEPDIKLYTLQTFLKEIAFYTTKFTLYDAKCYLCKMYTLTQIKNEFRLKCPEMFKSCTWNDVEFDCCEKFLPLETEMGICFVINSFHTGYSGGITLYSNMISGPGKLLINIGRQHAEVFFHSPEDVPLISTDSDQRDKLANKAEARIVRFKTIELKNDDGIDSLEVSKRGCLFPNEVPPLLQGYKYYSYSTCITQCHVDAQIKLCNCTHHLMPFTYKDKYCDLDGLLCLTANIEILSTMKASVTDQRPGVFCNCLPSCTEPEYNIVFKTNKGNKNGDNSIEYILQNLPSHRFKRNVVRSKLDFVVSIGGVIGLFFGASLLSFVELLYFFCLRKWQKTLNNKHSF